MNVLKAGLRRISSESGLDDAVLRWAPGRPLIVMYHGVTAAEESTGIANIARKHLPIDRFAAQIRLLKKYRRVIGLPEMVASLREGRSLRDAVAVTFDDGYENNVVQAAGVLVDEKIPATFFLTTSYIGTDRWMWTDLLEHVIDNTRAARFSGEDGAFTLSTREDKVKLFQSMKERLKRLGLDERDREVAETVETLLPDAGTPTGDHRFMDWDQARGLASAGFELGAHTVNHAILSRLTTAQAEAEMVGSRDEIVARTGRCSPVFCYPNGRPVDYSPEVIDLCRRHFSGALSTRRGAPTKDQLYELPRVGSSGGADAFARVLIKGR